MLTARKVPRIECIELFVVCYEMWSFVYANPAAFPEVAGPVRYVDARTCVLPVKLEPARTYGIWINSQKHDSFRDLGHRPAVPYLLVFETRGAPASR